METRRLAVLTLILLAAAAPVSGGEKKAMTLAECLTQALRSSLEIREGRYLPPIARTKIEEADSEFDHLLTFRASGGQSDRPPNSFFSGADEVKEQTFAGAVELGARIRTGGFYAFGIQANDLVTNSRFFLFRPQWDTALTFHFEQPILRAAGRDYNDALTRLAEKDLTAAEADFRGVLESTLAAVERAYWDLAFLHRDLEVRIQSKTVAERLLEIAKRRLENGAGTKVEVLQAEAGVAEREKQLILAQKAVRDAEDALRAFVFPFPEGPAEEIRIVPVDPVEEEPPATDESLPSRLRAAFENRPDVLASRARLEAAGIRVVRAENELLPRLDLFADLSYAGLDDDAGHSYGDLFGRDYPAWQIGLTLEFPIGNRAARARHRRAILERGRTAAAFESLKNRVVVDLRVALRRIETARQEIEATRKARTAARAQFEAEKDRVKADKATTYDLLEKEEAYSRAKSEEILALVAYRNALADLEEATGTYLARRGILSPEPEEGGGPERDSAPSRRPPRGASW